MCLRFNKQKTLNMRDSKWLRVILTRSIYYDPTKNNSIEIPLFIIELLYVCVYLIVINYEVLIFNNKYILFFPCFQISSINFNSKNPRFYDFFNFFIILFRIRIMK